MRMLLALTLVLAMARSLEALTVAARPRAARASPPRLSAVDPSPLDDRQGRLGIALLASFGVAETGTITANKLFGAGSEALNGLCSATGGSCASVLDGPWASVSGVPLALFGMIAYAAVAILAAMPLVSAIEEGGNEGGAADATSPAKGAEALVFASGALAAFSSCLMLLLLLVIKESCALCIGSAAISLAIFLIAMQTPLLGGKTETTVYAGSGGLISAAAAAALFYVGDAQAKESAPPPLGEPPTVVARSSPRSLEVARQLEARGGRFFGAYWCSHCYNQKQTLGIEAMKLVPYVECDREGKNSRRSECLAAGVKGYPTWQLDGKLFPGERDLDELEDMLKGKAQPQED